MFEPITTADASSSRMRRRSASTRRATRSVVNGLRMARPWSKSMACLRSAALQAGASARYGKRASWMRPTKSSS